MNSTQSNPLWIFLAALSLLLSGCTHEDNRYCPQGLYICFMPDNPAHSYPEAVQSVRLYFYHPDGTLAQKHTYMREELRAGDRAAFVPEIAPGEYTLLAVINGQDFYTTEGQGNFYGLQTALAQKTSSERLPGLFSGQRNLTVVLSDTRQEELVKLAKHTNHLRLKVIFDGYTLPDDGYISAFVDGSNGIFHYQSYTSRDYRLYLPHNEMFTEGRYLIYDFTTFRLWHGSDMTLRLREQLEGGGVLQCIDLDLEAQLARVQNAAGQYLYDTDTKLEYYDNYEIELTIGPGFVVVGLTVNDWSVIGGGVDV